MNRPIDKLKPPYYAVIFTSLRNTADDGYAQASRRLSELVLEQPGCLGFEAAREELGITVSYWDSLESIKTWRQNPEHQAAIQRAGDWYDSYRVRICRVEHDYGC